MTNDDIREAYLRRIKARKLFAKDVTREWMLGKACKTCTICGQLNGQKTLMFKPYSVAGIVFLTPPAHGGCDCSERYVTNLTDYKKSPF